MTSSGCLALSVLTSVRALDVDVALVEASRLATLMETFWAEGPSNRASAQVVPIAQRLATSIL